MRSSKLCSIYVLVLITIFLSIIVCIGYSQTHNYAHPYGVNSWQWPLTVCQDWKNAHIDSYRIMCDWYYMEQTDNTYNWTVGGLDTALQNAKTVGAKLSLCVYNSPMWARDLNPDKILGFSPPKFNEFLLALLQHCETVAPGVVEAVEIMNEEPTQEDYESFGRDPSWYYANILKSAYTTIKTNYPNIIVTIDGIWSGAFHHLDELYQLGCKGYFDRINFHYYVHLGVPENPDDLSSVWHYGTSIKYLKYIADEHQDYNKLLWLTEFGWRIDQFGWPGYTGEITKSNYMRSTLDTSRKSGFVDKTYVYVGITGGYPNDHDTIAIVYSDSDYNPSFLINTTAYYMYQSYGTQYPTWTTTEDIPVVPAPTKGVYLINPGFETGDGTGWDEMGTIDSSVKHSGSYSCKASPPTGIRTKFYKVEPGKLYEIRAWVKITADNGSDGVKIMPAVFSRKDSSANANYWGPPNYYGVCDTKNYPGGWRFIRFPYVVPEDQNEISFKFESHFSTGTGTFWVDDFELKPLNLLTTSQAYLVISETSLDFGELAPDETKEQTFNIVNNGAGTLTGTITTNKNWITVSPTTINSNNVVVTVKVDATVLNEVTGDYEGTVTINTNGGTETVSVKVTATCVLVKPNPYNPNKGLLTFFGSGIVPGKTTIKIYTLSGELVKELSSKNGEIVWDGKNESGVPVVNGIYIYTSKSPKENLTGKFTVVY